MGRKTSLSNFMVQESSIGISDSKTEMTEIDNAELVKYCPVGLTGNDVSSSSSSFSVIRFTFTFIIFGLEYPKASISNCFHNVGSALEPLPYINIGKLNITRSVNKL